MLSYQLSFVLINSSFFPVTENQETSILTHVYGMSDDSNSNVVNFLRYILMYQGQGIMWYWSI